MKKVAVGFGLSLLMGVSACNLRGQKPDQAGQDSSSLASTSYGKLLARLADERGGSARWGAGDCYLAVWQVFLKALGSGIENTSVPARSAYMFGDWADQNPNDLASNFKLKKASGAPEHAPVGSVLVYNPGLCRASWEHGHIEIVVQNKWACSDFCRPIPTNCAYPRLYVPIDSGAPGVASNAPTASKNVALTTNSGKTTSYRTACGTKMINICIQYQGGVAACNRKYACSSSTLM
jgi:hypothetical protein